MKKSFMLLAVTALVFVSFVFTGCLTTQKKEYSFKINSDGSGTGKIKFINIISQEDDKKDVSFTDFGELVDQWINGEKFAEENPNYQVVSKILKEEKGVLVGEVEFKFNNLADVKFLYEKGSDCAPIYYYLGAMSETYSSSNGVQNDESVPIIKWPAGTKEFSFTTIVNEPDSTSHSLLPQYKAWKESQK